MEVRLRWPKMLPQLIGSLALKLIAAWLRLVVIDEWMLEALGR